MRRDYTLTYHFNDRAALVAFGEKLGRSMQENSKPEAWTIRLEGDFNSGKSLVALAIDKAFQPGAYPKGLNGAVRIQTLMPDWHLNKGLRLHTVFMNAGHALFESKESFDDALQGFVDHNKGSRVVIVSNIHRTIVQNDLEYGLDSDRLDIAIEVLKSGDDFARDVTLVTKDKAVYQAMLP